MLPHASNTGIVQPTLRAGHHKGLAAHRFAHVRAVLISVDINTARTWRKTVKQTRLPFAEMHSSVAL